MWMQQMIRVLKSPWLYIGVLVALAAFVSGLLHGMAEPTQVGAQENTTGLNPRVVPSVATPDPSKVVTIERDKVYGRSDMSSRKSVTKHSLSKAQQEFRDAPPGRALYFPASDKVIHLPDDVRLREIIMSISGISCPVDSTCVELPIYVLIRGEATIGLDNQGKIVPDVYESDDPKAFPFLRED